MDSVPFAQSYDDSLRIVQSIDDTERGASMEWKNVQKAVVSSSRRLHIWAQQLSHRIDRIESKMDELTSAVSTLIDDRRVKEERYASDNRAFTRSWAALQEDVLKLKEDFQRSEHAQSEGLRVVREVVIPELENEIDSVKEVSRAQTRKDVRLEQAEQDLNTLRQHKVDSCDFTATVRDLRNQLDQLQLFPALRAEAAQQTMGFSGNRSVCSRWLWHGGSFQAGSSKAIPWEERLCRVGEGLRWSSAHPSVVKVDHEGIYRVTVAVFHTGRDSSVPAVTLYINNDAVVNALSTNSSCVLRSFAGVAKGSARKDAADAAVCGRCRVVRCCCDPEVLSGLTVTDIFYFPAGSVVTVAYRADPRFVTQGLLELEALS